MTKVFKITGMHCQSCVDKVTTALEALDGVDSAVVGLESSSATIAFDSAVETETLREAVRSVGFSLSEIEDIGSESDGDADKRQSSNSRPQDSSASRGKQHLGAEAVSRWRTYYPLLLIVTFLLGGCVLLQLRAPTWEWPSFMSDFMGAFFVVFAFFKLLDVGAFATAFASYDLVAAKSRIYGLCYPLIELGLGILYLTRTQPTLTNGLTLALMLTGTFGVVVALRKQGKIQCACLGTVFELPMSKVTLIEDLGMAVMALAMLVVGDA